MQTKCSHLLTGGDYKSERSACGPRLREAGIGGKQSFKGDPDPTDTDRRYTAPFPNNNALAVNLILILKTEYGAHTAEQCVCYV